MKKSTEENLLQSLTAQDSGILPYLPYLLQDLWELGSSYEEISAIFNKFFKNAQGLRLLDLGCGKGAISIRLCKDYNLSIKGIDIIPEFIKYADKKAQELGVGNSCVFETGDITKSVKKEKNYDFALLGAVGVNVLGGHKQALEKLKKCVKSGGYIIIDDAYKKSGDALRFNDDYITLEQWKEIILKTKLQLTDISILSEGDEDRNDEDFLKIKVRAEELSKEYPDKKYLFDNYIKTQSEEYQDLAEDNLTAAVFLIRK